MDSPAQIVNVEMVVEWIEGLKWNLKCQMVAFGLSKGIHPPLVHSYWHYSIAQIIFDWPPYSDVHLSMCHHDSPF